MCQELDNLGAVKGGETVIRIKILHEKNSIKIEKTKNSKTFLALWS